MKPCLLYTNNGVWRQLWHIATELLEVAAALLRGDYTHAAEELADVQVGCETMLYILGYHTPDDRNHIRNLVDRKNAVRGYHGRESKCNSRTF